MDGERGSGAALRRRERRLRAWPRHVRTAVQLALAEKLHHSANKVEPHDALRGQNKRAGREEVEHATHYGPRAQKTPPPGERPGILAEPGPQRSDRSRRHSSGECLPTLGLPVLAGAAGEQVDASTLRYLLAHAIEMRKVLEEEERRKEEEQKKAARSSASSAPKRTRKKRRKRRLPRGYENGDVGMGSALALRCLVPARHHGGVCQKDSCALLVNSGSGLCKVGFTGDYAPRSMFPSVDDRPQMLDIMAGTDQKNFYVDIGCMLGWICW